MAKRDDFDLTTKGRDALIEAARNKNHAQARRLLAGGDTSGLRRAQGASRRCAADVRSGQ